MQLVAEAQARAGRPRQHAPPGTPSRRTAHPSSESAQPHERHSRLHGARAVAKRRRAQPAGRDLPAAARLVGRQAPTRVPARKPGLLLEHELSRARGDPPARHRAVAGHDCFGNESSSRSASRQRRTRADAEPSATNSCTATTSPGRRPRTSRCTGSADPGPTARSCRTRTTWRCSSSRCCADGSSRPDSSPRWRRSFPARTVRGWGCTGSRRRAVAGSTATPAGRPAMSRSPRAQRDGRRFFVVDWNGVSPDAIHAMDKYLDDLICRR